MQHKLTIKNIYNIVKTPIPVPGSRMGWVVDMIEDFTDVYKLHITENHTHKMILYINRSLKQDLKWDGDNPFANTNTYACEMKYGKKYSNKWFLEPDDFKNRDKFIVRLGEMIDCMITTKVMDEIKYSKYTLSDGSNPTPKTITLHGLKVGRNYKRIEPTLYTPEKPKPNLTHKIKKIMQGLGQLPDYILHNIQYYIRKIV